MGQPMAEQCLVSRPKRPAFPFPPCLTCPSTHRTARTHCCCHFAAESLGAQGDSHPAPVAGSRGWQRQRHSDSLIFEAPWNTLKHNCPNCTVDQLQLTPLLRLPLPFYLCCPPPLPGWPIGPPPPPCLAPFAGCLLVMPLSCPHLAADQIDLHIWHSSTALQHESHQRQTCSVFWPPLEAGLVSCTFAGRGTLRLPSEAAGSPSHS